MKNFNFLSLWGTSLDNGSRMVRDSFEISPIISRKLFTLLFCLFLGFGQMWAADPTHTTNFTKDCSFASGTQNVTVNSATWTVTTTVGSGSPSLSFGNTYSNGALIGGTGASKYFSTIKLTTSYFSTKNVKKVEVSLNGNTSVSKTVSAKQGSTTIGSETKNVGTTWATYTCSGTAGAGGNLEVTITSGAASTAINSIIVTYTEGGTTHTLNKAVSPTGAGSVELSATSLLENTGTATATATANTGYVFNNWSISGAGATLSSTTTNPTTVTMGTANATVTANFLQQVATPTLSVGTGTYNNYQSVTLSCSTSDATIRYTTDGSEPTSTSTVYSTAIAVEATNTTIKAKAFKNGMAASNTASATYTLTCAAPSLTTGGTFNTNQSVTISCGTENAVIRYTTDNSNPTESSTIYNGAISVTQSTTIKAKAFKTGMNASGVAYATYTLKCLAPSIAPDAGAKTGAIEVTMTPNTEGSTIHYTSGANPSAPTGSSPTYSAAIDVDCSTTFKAIATKTGWSNSDVTTAAYTIKYKVHWVVSGTPWDDKGGSSLVECGSTATLPDAPDPGEHCGHKFMGWTTVQNHDAASAPSPLITSAPTITGDVTYYAVFGYYEE